MRLGPTIVGLVVLVCVALLGQGSASAEPPLPVYGGLLDFPRIKGPADPEEYPWKVNLWPGQELRQIDDQNAAIYFEDGMVMGSITAPDAHDATGAAVPTSILVSEGDVVTLTVYHRAGNPAKEGAPFVYPVDFGHAFEVGFSSVKVVTPPQEISSAESSTPALANCTVPPLKGWSLKADRKKLRDAGCRLGEVRGARSKTAKVVRQSPRPGAVLASGAEVGIKLGG